MISKTSIPMIQDSIVGGASAGGMMEVLEDITLLDGGGEDTALKIFVSIFSAFIVPAIRTWIKNRKARRLQRKKLKGMQYPFEQAE